MEGGVLIVCVPPAVLLPALIPVLTVKLLVLKALTARLPPLAGFVTTSIVIQKSRVAPEVNACEKVANECEPTPKPEVMDEPT